MKPSFLRTQITALAFIENDSEKNKLVCAGEGAFLRVFRVDLDAGNSGRSKPLKPSLLNSTEVFPHELASRIHGIRKIGVSNGDAVELAVFGGRFLRVLALERDSGLVAFRSSCIDLKDWISDIKSISTPANELVLAVLTARNVLTLLQLPDLTLVSTIPGESGSLVSGSIYGTTLDKMQIASGTAINGIVVWTPTQPLEPLARLIDHAGAVYSLAWSPDGSTLASFGEDRTVRVWENLESTPAAVLYGHASSVWRGSFVGDSLIASGGEDATCRLWSWGSKGDNNRGKCSVVLSAHLKPDIWSLAVDRDAKFLVTGGADGSVKLWDVEAAIKEQNEIASTNTVSLPSWESYSTSGEAPTREESIRNFALLEPGQLVVVTSTGHFLLHSLERSSWTPVHYAADFAGFTRLACRNGVIVAVSHAGHLVVLSRASGMGSSFVVSETLKVNLSGAISGIYAVVGSNSSQLEIFAQTDRGEIAWTRGTTGTPWTLEQIATLDPPSDRTGFPLDVAVAGDLILVSTAQRRLLIYNTRVRTPQLAPVGIFTSLHDNEVISSIFVDGNAIWTTGKDGFVRHWRFGVANELPDEAVFIDSSGRFSLELLTEHRVPGIAEQLDIFRSGTIDSKTFLVGFADASFYVLDLSSGRTLFSQRTSNTRRQFELLVTSCADSELGSDVTFGCLVSGNVVLRRTRYDFGASKTSSVCLQAPCHAMRINTVLPLSDRTFATGAEDGLLKIWCVYEAGALEELQCLSLVQPIKSLARNDRLVFAAGAQGLLAALTLNSDILALVRQAPSEEADYRIMSLSCAGLADGSTLLFVGQSDGIVRLRRFSETDGFVIVFESLFHSKCLLRCKVVITDTRIYGFSAATDGKVLVWRFGSVGAVTRNFRPEPILTLDLHPSGVNGLDTLVDGNRVLLATSGDDGDIMLAILVEKDSHLELLSTTRQRASFSTVRAIAFLSASTLASVGNEQCLSVWKISLEDTTGLAMVDSWRTPIADASDVVPFDEDRVLISGQGLEMIKFQSLEETE